MEGKSDQAKSASSLFRLLVHPDTPRYSIAIETPVPVKT